MRSQSSFIIHSKVHPLFIEKSIHNEQGKKEKRKKKDFIIEKDEVKNPPYKSHNQINKSLEGAID